MSESKIRRKNKTFDITLDAATGTTSTIVLGDMAGGMADGRLHAGEGPSRDSAACGRVQACPCCAPAG